MGQRQGGSTKRGFDIVKVRRDVGWRGVGQQDGLFSKVDEVSVNEMSVDELSVDDLPLYH
jgi:hypothetical protein